MGRLIDIEDLQGCAIIRPQKHSEFELIKQFSDIVSHDDIPTAYNVDKVVEQVKEITERINNYCEEIDHNIPEDERSGYKMLPDIFKLREVVKAGGVNG